MKGAVLGFSPMKDDLMWPFRDQDTSWSLLEVPKLLKGIIFGTNLSNKLRKQAFIFLLKSNLLRS